MSLGVLTSFAKLLRGLPRIDGAGVEGHSDDYRCHSTIRKRAEVRAGPDAARGIYGKRCCLHDILHEEEIGALHSPFAMYGCHEQPTKRQRRELLGDIRN